MADRAAFIDKAESWAQLVDDTREAGLKLAHYFERLTAIEAELRKAGLGTEAHFDPHVRAAFNQWRSARREVRAASEAPVTLLPDVAAGDG